MGSVVTRLPVYVSAAATACSAMISDSAMSCASVPHHAPPTSSMFTRRSAPGDHSGSRQSVDGEHCPSSLLKMVELTCSAESRLLVERIIEQFERFSDSERLLFCMKLLNLLSCKTTVDPLKIPVNVLGSRTEIHNTIVWIKTHLEEDVNVSMPKHEIYSQYQNYCINNGIKHMSTADFGKVMKQVYPSVRPRRLGTRGHSRYCYSGLRRRMKLAPPELTDLTAPQPNNSELVQDRQANESYSYVLQWANQHFGITFDTLSQLSSYLMRKKYSFTNSSQCNDESFNHTSNEINKPSVKFVKGRKKKLRVLDNDNAIVNNSFDFCQSLSSKHRLSYGLPVVTQSTVDKYLEGDARHDSLAQIGQLRHLLEQNLPARPAYFLPFSNGIIGSHSAAVVPNMWSQPPSYSSNFSNGFCQPSCAVNQDTYLQPYLSPNRMVSDEAALHTSNFPTPNGSPLAFESSSPFSQIPSVFNSSTSCSQTLAAFTKHNISHHSNNHASYLNDLLANPVKNEFSNGDTPRCQSVPLWNSEFNHLATNTVSDNVYGSTLYSSQTGTCNRHSL